MIIRLVHITIHPPPCPMERTGHLEQTRIYALNQTMIYRSKIKDGCDIDTIIAHITQ